MDEIKIALQLEKDGYAYYAEAAERCQNDYGKKMFERLARDEIDHRKRFRAIAEDLFGEVDEGEGRHLDIFENIDFSTVSGEYAALDHAIAFEKKAQRFFADAAERARDENLKKLFRTIAREEETHRALLEAERAYLHKSGIWFDYQEFEMDGM
jgi:rubrerythrin